MSIVAGAIVKTKPDSSNTPNGAFKVFASANGAVIGTQKPDAYMGRFVKEVGNWSQVELRAALKGQKYGWIETVKLVQWTAPNAYYIASGRTGVNVRTAPSLTSNVLKKLNGGQLVGKSDGYQENGFILFALNGGGIGWVSRDYVTRSNGTTPIPTTTGTGGPVTEPIPDENLNIAKYAGYAIVFLTCVLLISITGYAIKARIN